MGHFKKGLTNKYIFFTLKDKYVIFKLPKEGQNYKTDYIVIIGNLIDLWCRIL